MLKLAGKVITKIKKRKLEVWPTKKCMQ